MRECRKKKKAIFLFAACLLFLFLWLYWGNTSIQISQIDIRGENIPAKLEGFTIVQVSDLHNAAFGSNQDRLLDSVKYTNPNIIAVTGDLIDSNHTDITKAMEFVNGAVEIAPVYYVTGNHEAWSVAYTELKEQMIDAGVIILEDEKIAIKHNGAPIELLGLHDPDFASTKDTYEKTAQIDAKLINMLDKNDAYHILLAHRPELFDIYAANGIDLVLSGHAHGGQVRIPFLGGLIAPNQGFFPQYSEGVYQKDNTRMVVSRGLGNSIIPLRIHNRPEIVVVTLTP